MISVPMFRNMVTVVSRGLILKSVNLSRSCTVLDRFYRSSGTKSGANFKVFTQVP